MTNQILVVDDDQLMHMLFEHHLEGAGYRMLSAMNGQQALEMANAEQPALIVMDVMMPDIDGLAVLRELKKEGAATKAIPVIIITSNKHALMEQESKNAGAAMFLTKPFSPTQLLNEIRRLAPTKA